MNQVFQVNIFPVKPQEALMRRYFGAYRYIYNYYRTAYITAYDRNQSRFDEDAANELLIKLVQQDRALQIVDFRVLQGALDDVNADFTEFYQGADSGKKSYPRKISDSGSRQFFRIAADANNIRCEPDYISIHGLGKLDYDGTRIEGTIRQITVTRNAPGQYLMSVFCDDMEERRYPFTGEAVGIVRGDKGFAAASTGKYYSDAPEIIELRAQMSALRKEDNELDSEALKSLRKALAKENKSFISRITTHFIKNYDRIYVEAMDDSLRDGGLLSAEDYLWKCFLEQLEKKAELNNRVYLELDADEAAALPPTVAHPTECAPKETAGDAGSSHPSPLINKARSLLATGERLSNYIEEYE
ncbi:MAG: transposase [Syntrophomonadaceae bacterium]|nr:transposase [Syntrophomonadaceae bacterium]